ncbi:DUF4259 domain-containing protein [Micromonospora parva]|uniref:DUF4259 domain-containing protein n=1 Tax=Micromonospora parva TaxID=1464048 RepID=A0ABW6W3K7_9ACTN
MATWQFGPFDNDDAVEWCGTLENTAPDQRVHLVRRTLSTAVSAGRTLAVDDAARAIAAAATVLQSVSGMSTADSPYAPRFLTGTEDLLVTPSLRDLAMGALDAVLADGSAWRLRWAEDVEEEEALAVIDQLHSRLANAPL